MMQHSRFTALLSSVLAAANISYALQPTAIDGLKTPSDAVAAKPEAFKQMVPATAFEFEMLPIPGDEAKGIKPFYMAKTELTWEAFDVWVYSLDVPSDAPAAAVPGNGGSDQPATAQKPAESAKDNVTLPPDAVSRPSKPYLPPDRGFGHEGYAVICVTHKGATEYCKWLSAKTGRKYRLPTRAEWQHAARAGVKEGDVGYVTGVAEDQLLEFAWLRDNAEEKPHAVGSKKANSWGLHDMIGNVQEWVMHEDGKPVTIGGSYRTKAADISIDKFAKNNSAWNASDPQVPKSPWWLADGPFIGFRIVCEQAEEVKDK